jgi:hypothetical protein
MSSPLIIVFCEMDVGRRVGLFVCDPDWDKLDIARLVAVQH